MIVLHYIFLGHLDGCLWNDALNTGYGYWGCDCGYDNWEIEHEDRPWFNFIRKFRLGL